jgi:ArsR family transcriptional regulator, lead/cadmium/zinc/bismuth-responsive transcriptional repressor
MIPSDPYTNCEVEAIHDDLVAHARGSLVNPEDADDIARTFQALSDPTRVRLVSALLDTELCVCDLSMLLGMTQSAISHQLRLLRDLRLVKSRKEGRIVFYALDDDHIKELFTRTREHLLHG